MHAMISEFHEMGPLLPSGEEESGEQHPAERLMLRVNTFLVEHRWSPDVVRAQLVVTALPGPDHALYQLILLHPALTAVQRPGQPIVPPITAGP